MCEEIDFDELEVVSKDGEVMVSLEYIGEGYGGEYGEDEEDEEDEPLLRFRLFRKFHEDQDEDKRAELCYGDAYEEDEWMEVRSSSHCTHLRATDSRKHLTKAAKFILKQVEDGIRNFNRQKTLYEELSWIRIENGTTVCPNLTSH